MLVAWAGAGWAGGAGKVQCRQWQSGVCRDGGQQSQVTYLDLNWGSLLTSGRSLP
jgi:hypothetical protein